MITQDYIRGYIDALRTIEENLEHRLNIWNDKIRVLRNANILCGEDESEIYFAQSELLAVKDHINQIRESYKKLVKDLNGSK